MPLYEYECRKCGERFEIIQKFSDDPVTAHAEYRESPCNGPVRKLLAAPAIQFKGTGWYVTDYGKGGKKPAKETGDSAPQKETKSSGDSDSSSKAAKPPAKGGKSASSTAAAAS